MASEVFPNPPNSEIPPKPGSSTVRGTGSSPTLTRRAQTRPCLGRRLAGCWRLPTVATPASSRSPWHKSSCARPALQLLTGLGSSSSARRAWEPGEVSQPRGWAEEGGVSAAPVFPWHRLEGKLCCSSWGLQGRLGGWTGQVSPHCSSGRQEQPGVGGGTEVRFAM